MADTRCALTTQATQTASSDKQWQLEVVNERKAALNVAVKQDKKTAAEDIPGRSGVVRFSGIDLYKPVSLYLTVSDPIGQEPTHYNYLFDTAGKSIYLKMSHLGVTVQQPFWIIFHRSTSSGLSLDNAISQTELDYSRKIKTKCMY